MLPFGLHTAVDRLVSAPVSAPMGKSITMMMKKIEMEPAERGKSTLTIHLVITDEWQ
jgi:hypothetical protein